MLRVVYRGWKGEGARCEKRIEDNQMKEESNTNDNCPRSYCMIVTVL